MSIIVCPDVHGRDFHESLFENTTDKIIFLGDYEDPYHSVSIDTLLESMGRIFEFARNNPDRVILLLGNHSMYYYFKKLGNARYNLRHAGKIEQLYDEYRDLFKLVYYDEETQTMFSHAGISDGWVNDWGLYDSQLSPKEAEYSLNSLLNIKYFNCLESISGYRGGEDLFGSCLWADVNEHFGEVLPFKNQIFGHTQLMNTGTAIRQHNWIMCDSRCIFTWDGENFKKYLEE